MCFEADASSIDIKQLLQKDFLELSMRVISDANPNVNKSWFTPESMEDALPTFVNKPILGYFENGDFVSHDGEWNYDSETQMNYWDTLGKKGERILGMIRESDGVEIVDGNDGLKWIELKCCLWVQYGYKQVKRLLKDAKKAKKEGGPAKNVSVEVDILDAEKLPNGVLKINKFNLIGITILGSRNGVKVEPGIENAGLSVIDIMGKDAFEAQEKAIRLAYEKIDNPNNIKEEFSNMENENKTIEEQEVKAQESNTQSEQFSNAENNPAENSDNTTPNPENNPEAVSFEDGGKGDTDGDGEVCPECGKNPCVCEDKTQCSSENGDDDADADDEDKKKDDDDKDEDKADNCKYDANANVADAPTATPCSTGSVVYDLTYLLNTMNNFAVDLTYTAKYYAECKPDEQAVIAFLDRVKRQAAEDIATVGGLISDKAAELKGVILQYEQEISEDTISSLYKKFEAEKAKNVEYNAKIEEVKKAEFLKEAQEVITLAELNEEDSKKMFESCESGEVNDIDALKNNIALKLFEERITFNKNKSNSVKEKNAGEKPVTFSAPINEPAMAESKPKKKVSGWDALREYNKN